RDYFVCPQAIEGTYIDKKCPFTGNVSIRGRILSGGHACTPRLPVWSSPDAPRPPSPLRGGAARCAAGVVTKMKMQRTIVIRRDYLHYIRKYNRFEKRHKNMSVHLSPAFR
uniref:Ribosomal protein S11 n=1 Tax=Lepisosteus oculatus TaxID=7918 RepID=W5MIR9_LEPOC